MRHAGTQTIETERLLLRPLTPEDAPMMYANWANDPDVTPGPASTTQTACGRSATASARPGGTKALPPKR